MRNILSDQVNDHNHLLRLFEVMGHIQTCKKQLRQFVEVTGNQPDSLINERLYRVSMEGVKNLDTLGNNLRRCLSHPQEDTISPMQPICPMAILLDQFDKVHLSIDEIRSVLTENAQRETAQSPPVTPSK